MLLFFDPFPTLPPLHFPPFNLTILTPFFPTSPPSASTHFITAFLHHSFHPSISFLWTLLTPLPSSPSSRAPKPPCSFPIWPLPKSLSFLAVLFHSQPSRSVGRILQQFLVRAAFPGEQYQLDHYLFQTHSWFSLIVKFLCSLTCYLKALI